MLRIYHYIERLTVVFLLLLCVTHSSLATSDDDSFNHTTSSSFSGDGGDVNSDIIDDTTAPKTNSLAISADDTLQVIQTLKGYKKVIHDTTYPTQVSTGWKVAMGGVLTIPFALLAPWASSNNYFIANDALAPSLLPDPDNFAGSVVLTVLCVSSKSFSYLPASLEVGISITKKSFTLWKNTKKLWRKKADIPNQISRSWKRAKQNKARIALGIGKNSVVYLGLLTATGSYILMKYAIFHEANAPENAANDPNWDYDLWAYIMIGPFLVGEGFKYLSTAWENLDKSVYYSCSPQERANMRQRAIVEAVVNDQLWALNSLPDQKIKGRYFELQPNSHTASLLEGVSVSQLVEQERIKVLFGQNKEPLQDRYHRILILNFIDSGINVSAMPARAIILQYLFVNYFGITDPEAIPITVWATMSQTWFERDIWTEYGKTVRSGYVRGSKMMWPLRSIVGVLSSLSSYFEVWPIAWLGLEYAGPAYIPGNLWWLRIMVMTPLIMQHTGIDSNFVYYNWQKLTSAIMNLGKTGIDLGNSIRQRKNQAKDFYNNRCCGRKGTHNAVPFKFYKPTVTSLRFELENCLINGAAALKRYSAGTIKSFWTSLGWNDEATKLLD